MIIKLVFKSNGKIASVNRFDVSQKKLETYADEIYIDGERIIFEW